MKTSYITINKKRWRWIFGMEYSKYWNGKFKNDNKKVWLFFNQLQIDDDPLMIIALQHYISDLGNFLSRV